MLIDLIEHQGFRDSGGVFFFKCVYIQTLLQQTLLCCHFHAYSEKDLSVPQLSMDMGFEVNPYFQEPSCPLLLPLLLSIACN